MRAFQTRVINLSSSSEWLPVSLPSYRRGVSSNGSGSSRDGNGDGDGDGGGGDKLSGHAWHPAFESRMQLIRAARHAWQIHS